jgi:hypothetical protein
MYGWVTHYFIDLKVDQDSQNHQLIDVGDKMAIIEESVEINYPVEKAFAFTTDAKSWNKWQSIILESEKISPGHLEVGTTFRGTSRVMGRTTKWTSTGHQV